MQRIKSLIESCADDMLNPVNNFEIAKEYELNNQTSAAVSFYLRAAEYGYENHQDIVYASLIRISFCIEDQKEREHTVSNCLLQAIQYMPDRPEAYFLMSRYYERMQKWQESYTFAEIGLSHIGRKQSLPADVGYPGAYGLRFQKALAGYNIGKKDETVSIFNELLLEDIGLEYTKAIQNNLAFINSEK